MRILQPLAFLLFASLVTFADDAAKNPVSVAPPPAADLFADRMTGDWGGLRSRLAERGISLDLESTHYYQGLMDGTGDKDWEYGGRLDAYLHLDTGKLGLWPGGGFHVHGSYFYGGLPANLGGTILPTNVGMKLPQDHDNEWVATAIYYSQKIGDRANLRLGMLDTVDLLGRDLFFGGYGNHRFQNLAFVAPPNGLTPPVIIGGLLSLKTGPLNWTLMVYDPNSRTAEYWPDDLFDDGVNFSLSATWAGKLAGRTTTVALGGIYSTKDSVDLADVLLPPDLRTGVKDESWHASLQLMHLLQESSARPGVGWGVFVKGGISDGNPNPYQAWVTGGLGGKGIIPSRPDDGFGLGYFFYKASDDLKSAVNPLVKLEDEHGMEVFYNIAVTPWFHVTADLQVISPALSEDTAVIGGLRANIRF